MTGAAVRRLARRLTPQANGNPAGVSGQPIFRQVTVTVVTADSVGVAYPEDQPEDDPVYMGWTSPTPPAVGQVGWVAEVNAHPIWIGAQNAQPSVSTFPRAAIWLTEQHSTARDQHTTGSATTILSLPVTVPAGLPVGAQLRVEGRIVQGISAAGVGLILDIPLLLDGDRSQTEGSFSGGLTVVKYRTDPPAGLTTYAMTLQTTVSGNTVTGRYPSMEAWIV
jgi:hypothetical protein